MINTLAYNDTYIITAVKSLVTPDPGCGLEQGTLTEGEGSIQLTS
jgi:hypothetical protein